MSDLDVCRTCGKEVAASVKKCPHCGESVPGKKAYTKGKMRMKGVGIVIGTAIVVGVISTILKGNAIFEGAVALMVVLVPLAFIVGLIRPAWFRLPDRKSVSVVAASAFAIVVIALISVTTPDRPPREESSARQGQATEGPEDGISAGFANLRVLNSDMLSQLKIEAVAAGKDPAYMYPETGPVAILQVPVNQLTVEGVVAIGKLLCAGTISKNPAQWKAYSEVRIINRHVFTGYVFDLRGACSGEMMEAQLVQRSLGGAWDVEFPYKLATERASIGYGRYQ